MKSILRFVWLMSCVLLLSQVGYSQSSFSSARVDYGNGCSWPFSTLATNPNNGDIYGFWRDGSGTSAVYKLIKWTGSSWSSVGSFNISAVTSATTFDAASDYVSMDIDDNGYFHIVIAGSKTGSCCSQPRGLVYGYSTNGTSWTFELVDSYTDPSGWQNIGDASIKVSKTGVPHIGAQFTNSNNTVSFKGGSYNRLYTVMHFVRTGSSTWSKDYPFYQGGASNEVNQVSFDLDTNDIPHFAFVAETNGSGLDGSLMYTYYTGSGWATAQKLIAGNGSSSPFTYEYEGYANDIAIDPTTNKVYIISTNYQSYLKMTTNASGSFSTSIVNSSLKAWSGEGNFNITDAGTQFIGYWDNTSGNLKTAIKASGASTYTISSGSVSPGGGANFMSSILSSTDKVMFLFDKPPSGSCGSTNHRELWYGYGDASSSTPPTVPTVTFTPSTVCSGSSATLNISGTLNDATAWHVYTGSCGGTSVGSTATSSFSVSPSSTTTYYVRGEGGGVTPGSCGSVSVTITANQSAAFSYSAAAYCVNAADPTPTITGNTGGTFSSTAGLSLNSSTGAIDVSASTPGTYTVTYTNTGSCGTSSTKSVTINALDNASFSYSAAAYCVNASDPTPTITGLTGGSFSSTSGLSLNTSTGAIDVSASTPGTYTVTYTTAGTCPNSSNVSVTINALDDPSFSYSASAYCKDGSDPTPTITGLTGGTFSSTSGLSIAAGTGTIDVSASTAGTYTVTYTTAGNCPQSTTQNVTIHPIESSAFNYSASAYCQDGSDPTPTITGNTGGTFSSTSGLSLNTSTGAIDVSASTAGTYTVTYTTAGPCPTSTNHFVTINPIEDPSFSYASAAYCDNESDPTPTITGTSGGSFSSTSGLSIASSSGTIDLSASTGGTYVVTYATGGPCSQSTTFTVTVKTVTYNTISITAYETYSSPSGKTWTTSRTENDTLIGANSQGCDSIITINLTIINRLKTWGSGNPTLDDIIKAANATSNDVEIWVKEGVHYPGGQSSTNRDSAFVITNPNVRMLGGFSGTETDTSQRNPTTNPTVLCGDIGTPGDDSDNAHHLLILHGGNGDIEPDFVIDGLTIRDANANGSGKRTYAGVDLYQNEGGGISIIGEGSGLELSPTISNCQFINNSASYGGSVYIKVKNGKSFATITNCTFKDGAAIYGAIYNDGEGGEVSPNIRNCAFADNTSATSGAAIYNYGYGGKASPTITNCVFANNEASSTGGAIYNNGYAGLSSPTIFNSTFHNNTAASHAGAMYSFGNAGTCSPKVTNSVFYKNNVAGDDDYKFSEFYNYAAYPYVTYSSLQRASSTYSSATLNSLNGGGNNIFATNPLFESTTDLDGADNVWRTGDDGLRITSSSGLVNAGTNTGAMTTDILGSSKVGTRDIGAYEYVSCGLHVQLATSATTHTASQGIVDGDFVCYCNSDNELLLALDTNGSGAVITPNQVKLYIGNPSTLSYNTAGGMITNTAGGVILERRWDVDPTTQPTGTVGVRYFYTNDEYDDIVTAMANLTSPTTISSPSQLQFYKVTGGSSATFPNPHDAGVVGIVLTNGTTPGTTTWVAGTHGVQDHIAEYRVASFSGGGGGGGGGSLPLPVELIDFTAQAGVNHTANLQWKTASEFNNSHFVIERSYAGGEFVEVGVVAGNGTTQQVTSYTYTDHTIAPDQDNVLYRLRQVDFDGTTAESPIRRVIFTKDQPLVITQVYPNPTKDKVQVVFSEFDDAEQHQIRVTDLMGKQLELLTTEARNHTIDLTSYPKGIYFVTIDNGESFKIVKE